MSRRVTRSSAKQSADLSLTNDQPSPPPPQPPQPSSRKRKISTSDQLAEEQPEQPEASTSRKKRTRLSDPDTTSSTDPPAHHFKRTRKSGQAFGMSSSDTPGPAKGESSKSSPSVGTSSKKKAGKARKTAPESSDQAAAGSSGKRSRNSTGKRGKKTTVAATSNPEPEGEAPQAPDLSGDEAEAAAHADTYDEEDDEIMGDDPFSGGFLGRAGGMSGTLRALSGLGGMMGAAGPSSRLRSILESLRQYDDPSAVNVALTELSQLLLFGNDDQLAGHFAPDAFLKELNKHMDGADSFEPNPEIMLLACRCIGNMLEAVPSTAASVIYSGSLPILVSKLLSIEYMDLAEQALITLEKVSTEFPSHIVRAGGLSACLNFLDFFSTGVQRTAVTTAANCCRNIPGDSFDTVKEVMPILLGVLRGNDQRVVENGCLCVTRIVESFKYQDAKLEEIMSAEMLRAILSLLLPGSTNMIGSHIHTQFLRLLATIARASPTLAVELFKMNVVETLYQILTGVSPPIGTEDVAQKIDSVVIMQALIHRPREQIFETLNVICELLPALEDEHATFMVEYAKQVGRAASFGVVAPHIRQDANNKNTSKNRLELLSQCKPELRRFAVVLLPTLTDAYSSTVNLSVREKVLVAQMKMLSFLDTDILVEALHAVSFSSYLASIFSQQDHPNLVVAALEVAHTLLTRLENIYTSQFFREGVISEIKKISERPQQSQATMAKEPSAPTDDVVPPAPAPVSDEDEDDAHEDEDGRDDDSNSSDEEMAAHRRHALEASTLDPRAVQDLITGFCKSFIGGADNAKVQQAKNQAASIMEGLQNLASDITNCYDSGRVHDGAALFAKLSKFFEGDALESITSYELFTSNVVSTLLEVFQETDTVANQAARAAFIEVFMGTANQHKMKTATSQSPVTPFSMLVQKLQDLLSRAEHFEVLTVHSNTADSDRSSAASMLAKQIRIRLQAADDSGVPKSYRNIMVSIHAIATFKALDDYLRPRIAISERARAESSRTQSSGRGPSAPEALASSLLGGDDVSTIREAAIAARARKAANAAQLALLSANDSSGLIPPPPPPTTSSSKARPSGKAAKAKSMAAKENEATEEASSSSARKTGSGSRRSSRKAKPAAEETLTPPPPPAAEDDVLKSALECADEARLSDDDDDDEDEMEVDNTFEGIVDDLDEELAEDRPDPSAVNLEVAPTGKVTARQDDGTRVETPTGTPGAATRVAYTAALRASESMAMSAGIPRSLMSGSALGRQMSYAAALQAVPQDWHLEFTVNGQPIRNETTIYRAVHFNQTAQEDVSARNIWSQVHLINFKRVEGPPPKDLALSPAPETSRVSTASGLPQSLEQNPISAQILRLLRILHEMNSHVDDLMDIRPGVHIQTEPLAQFVNTKLTAKLNRQLEEPLIVASNCLPSWSEDLARHYPFLFPFETRHLFLQSTSFGYSRSMSKWQNGQAANETRQNRHRDERPFLGRLQRQKVRISRHKLLESAVKVMEMYGSSASVLEVEFFDEVGTGLGPTLEFYSNVSREFSKKKLKLWRENETGRVGDYAFGKQGLFPAPMSEQQVTSENGKRILTLFKMLGKFVARSMLDSRIIDVSFNPMFFRLCSVANDVPLSLGTVKTVDSDLAQSLQTIKQFAIAKKKIDEQTRLTAHQKAQKLSHVQVAGANIQDLGLDFTLPGHADIQLVPNGCNIGVTLDNVGLYLEKVIDYSLGQGVQKQIDAFKTGFSEVFPYSAMSAFTADELVMLFGRNDEDWSIETLMDSTKADHGYNLDSNSVRNLLQVMSELGDQQRRNFLQFITGSPKLPIGGFRSLTPMFTVVCKASESPYSPDDYLPSVMTCVNYLKLPDYSSLDVMRKQLNVAIREGQGAFHLS